MIIIKEPLMFYFNEQTRQLMTIVNFNNPKKQRILATDTIKYPCSKEQLDELIELKYEFYKNDV